MVVSDVEIESECQLERRMLCPKSLKIKNPSRITNLGGGDP